MLDHAFAWLDADTSEEPAGAPEAEAEGEAEARVGPRVGKNMGMIKNPFSFVFLLQNILRS